MIIKNGYIVDPANKREGNFDILIKGARIERVAKRIEKKGEKVLDAKKRIVTPGFIDMHVHLREPGREDMETVASGTRAGISGGITSVCAMPNTQPAIDNAREVSRLRAIIKKDALSNVFIIGAITKGRLGGELVDMKAMKGAGAAALTDDGRSVYNKDIMLAALKKAGKNGLLLISHCEDKLISKDGVVNEGIMATKLGLRGIPREAECNIVKRDIDLAGKAKARIHIAHVSCKESVDIIRKAKKKDGVAVTAETAPHYFSLTDTCCATYDTRTKMNPPLRSAEDVEAVKAGLADGTIDVIASDHAPHGKHEKEIEFDLAAFGIIGLETAFGLAAGLVKDKTISWARLVELMSVNPAGILGLRKKGRLSEGCDADITIVAPDEGWAYTKESILSKSKNSPFIDWRFKARAVDVIAGGRHLLQGKRFSQRG